jgi:hypothetical protein
MLQLKDFRFDLFRSDDSTAILFKASEVLDDHSSKSRGYVNSFTRTVEWTELLDLTSSLPSDATDQERYADLLRRVSLVPTCGPSGRMNNKGNIGLSFDAVGIQQKYLLAKISKRICTTLYIVEVMAEVSKIDGIKSIDMKCEENGFVLATQPAGRRLVQLHFKLYDPLSSFVLQTVSPIILSEHLEVRKHQIYSSLERLYVVESSEGRVAVLKYTRDVMKMVLSEAPHSHPCSTVGHTLDLTIGISCKEGRSDPLLMIHASASCSENQSCKLAEGSRFLFHPLVTMPPPHEDAYVDYPETKSDFEQLYAMLDDLCVVAEPMRSGVKDSKCDWRLWHHSEAQDIKVSHLSRRVQSARALDYTYNQKSCGKAQEDGLDEDHP